MFYNIKNGECGRKRRKDVYLIILYAREGRMGLMGRDGANGLMGGKGRFFSGREENFLW